MTKYIKVDWPEYQKFEEHERCNECYTCKVYGDDDIFAMMIPEDLYNEVMYKLQFPKRYEDTNLGTIVLYETRAVINGERTFWYDLSLLKRGDTVLVYKNETKEWIITTCVACSMNMPILLKEDGLFPNLNCEIIGVETQIDQVEGGNE